MKIWVSGEQAALWQSSTSLVLGYVTWTGHHLPAGSVFPSPTHPRIPKGREIGGSLNQMGPESPLIWEVLDPVWYSGTNFLFEWDPLDFISHHHHLLPAWPLAQQGSTLKLVFSYIKVEVLMPPPNSMGIRKNKVQSIRTQKVNHVLHRRVADVYYGELPKPIVATMVSRRQSSILTKWPGADTHCSSSWKIFPPCLLFA